MCEIWHCQSKASRTAVDRRAVVRRADRADAGCARRSLWGEIPADAAGDPCRGVLDGITGKVSVPGGRLNLRVT